MVVRSPTLHHGEGVLYLRFEQVDAHHRGQVLHVHLVHRRVQLHLEQEAANRRRQSDTRQIRLSGGLVPPQDAFSSFGSPADVAEKVVVDSG